MDRLPARVLEPGDVRRLLAHTPGQRHHLRNNVIIMLSFKAGLRACEIAGLDEGLRDLAHQINMLID